MSDDEALADTHPTTQPHHGLENRRPAAPGCGLTGCVELAEFEVSQGRRRRIHLRCRRHLQAALVMGERFGIPLVVTGVQPAGVVPTQR